MATIQTLKNHIAQCAITQRKNKFLNDQSARYMLRGELYALYTAYYILKHNLYDLNEQDIDLYLNELTLNGERFKYNGWRGIGYSTFSSSNYAFIAFKKFVVNTIKEYAEETLCTD